MQKLNAHILLDTLPITLTCPVVEAKVKRGQGPTSAGPLASLLNLPLSELTPDYIAAWLSTERQNRPTVTAHAYRLLRAFIKWSNYQKNIKDHSPAIWHKITT